MNSRDYKNFSSGEIYHVYNRGNNKEIIFLDDQDYQAFIWRLKIILGIVIPPQKSFLFPLPPNSFSIYSYCLMPNHFHFLIKQESSLPVTKLITKLCTSYSKYFNKKYNRVGHIFQDTFKAKLIGSDAYAMHVSAYIHNNPSNPITWKYSSFQSYITTQNDQICKTKFILDYFDGKQNTYAEYVKKTILLEDSLPTR